MPDDVEKDVSCYSYDSPVTKINGRKLYNLKQTLFPETPFCVVVLFEVKSSYTYKNAQVFTDVQGSCNKSVHHQADITECVRTACSQLLNPNAAIG